MFGYSVLTSIGKALKFTGITFVSVAGVAGAGFLMDPIAMGTVWAATGPVGGLAVFGFSMVGQVLKDFIKHRKD